MRITIVADDNLVIVDGVSAYGVDLSGLDPTVHAVQWDGARGDIEYRSDPDTGDRKMNFCIVDETPYLIYVDRYNARLSQLATEAEAKRLADTAERQALNAA